VKSLQRAIGVGVTAVCVTGLSPLAPAGAFPLQNDSCDKFSVYKFNNLSDWTSVIGLDGYTLNDESVAGISEWNSFHNYDGSHLVTLTNNNTSGVEQLQWLGSGIPAGDIAYTFCGWGVIGFDNAERGGMAYTPIGYMNAIARHEYGHVMELWHTGTTDSIGDSNIPTMATPAVYNATMSQDDVQQLNHKYGGLAASPADANFGFEESPGYSYWHFSGSTSWKVIGSGGNPGAYMDVLGASSADTMYQFNNVAQQAGHSVNVLAGVHLVKLASSDTGSVIFNVQKREVQYGAANSNYASGFNQNVRTYLGTWVSCTTGKITPTTSWAGYSSAPGCTIPTSWEGADLKLEIVPLMKDSGGASTFVGVDDFRVVTSLN